MKRFFLFVAIIFCVSIFTIACGNNTDQKEVTLEHGHDKEVISLPDEKTPAQEPNVELVAEKSMPEETLLQEEDGLEDASSGEEVLPEKRPENTVVIPEFPSENTTVVKEGALIVLPHNGSFNPIYQNFPQSKAQSQFEYSIQAVNEGARLEKISLFFAETKKGLKEFLWNDVRFIEVKIYIDNTLLQTESVSKTSPRDIPLVTKVPISQTKKTIVKFECTFFLKKPLPSNFEYFPGIADSSLAAGNWGLVGNYGITARGLTSGALIKTMNSTGDSSGTIEGTRAYVDLEGGIQITHIKPPKEVEIISALNTFQYARSYKVKAVNEGCTISEIPVLISETKQGLKPYSMKFIALIEVRIRFDNQVIGTVAFTTADVAKLTLPKPLYLKKDRSHTLLLEIQAKVVSGFKDNLKLYPGLADSTLKAGNWGKAGSYGIKAIGDASGSPIKYINTTGYYGGMLEEGSETSWFNTRLYVTPIPQGSRNINNGQLLKLVGLNLNPVGKDVKVLNLYMEVKGTCVSTNAGPARWETPDGTIQYWSWKSLLVTGQIFWKTGTFENHLFVVGGTTNSVVFRGSLSGCTSGQLLQFTKFIVTYTDNFSTIQVLDYNSLNFYYTF